MKILSKLGLSSLRSDRSAEPCGQLMAERLTAGRLGPNGLSNVSETGQQYRSAYLRIEALKVSASSILQAPPFVV